PGLWNVAAFYLFLLHPVPALGSLGTAILIVLTFVPLRFVHPVRVIRLRWLTLTLVSLWGALAIYTLWRDFNVGAPVTILLCVIALYVVGGDAATRFVRSLKE
ncbi:MAG: phosphatidylcholine synthase, partial [Alphaproteobacteria bacterium]